MFQDIVYLSKAGPCSGFILVSKGRGTCVRTETCLNKQVDNTGRCFVSLVYPCLDGKYTNQYKLEFPAGVKCRFIVLGGEREKPYLDQPW